jgi:formiminotetrahydrofolate cyclodeaminase
MMAATLPRSRTGSNAEREALSGARDALVPLQHELTVAVDLDHEAYRRLVATRNVSATAPLPANEPDRARQRAFQQATDVPLQVMRMSSRAMQQALTVAAHCHRPAVSDVRVAIALIRAGFAGARSSVQDNLARMTHGEYVEGARAEIDKLLRQADRAADAAEQALETSRG